MTYGYLVQYSKHLVVSVRINSNDLSRSDDDGALADNRGRGLFQKKKKERRVDEIHHVYQAYFGKIA